MTDSTKSAAQLLQELRKERDDLNTLIQALEKRLGIAYTSGESTPDDVDEEPRAVPPVTSMSIGFFHNLSQAAAAEKLLKMNPGQALTTSQILEAFKNSGMNVNPKNALTILYTALSRSQKFERVGSKAWGLREWYPERKKRISRSDTPSDEAAGQ
jgi:hypothetical protein